MGRMALNENKRSRLFPNLDADSSRALLYLISLNQKENKITIVSLMDNCQFEGMTGKFLPSDYKEFFNNIFKNLELLLIDIEGKKTKVFEKIKLDDFFLDYNFSKEFFKWRKEEENEKNI